MTKKEEKQFKDVYEVLSHVQKNIIAPKSQRNTHGNYDYRSCEDILEAAKKVMPDSAMLLLEDDIIAVPVEERLEYTKVAPLANGNDTTTDNRVSSARIYVKSTAILSYEGKEIKNVAFAREPSSQKGFNSSQITVAASSFARKTALSGMFMLDDDKEAEKKKKSNKETEPEDDFSGDIDRQKKEDDEEKVKKVFGGSSRQDVDEETRDKMYSQGLVTLSHAATLEKVKQIWSGLYKGRSVFTPEQFADLEAAKDQAKEELEREGKI